MKGHDPGNQLASIFPRCGQFTPHLLRSNTCWSQVLILFFKALADFSFSDPNTEIRLPIVLAIFCLFMIQAVDLSSKLQC